MKCSRAFHKSKKCSGLSRLEVDAVCTNGVPWTCAKCDSTPVDFSRVLGGVVVETSAEDVTRKSCESLKILQWNADGLRPKINELELRLKKERIDVVLIQETKLTPQRRTPKLCGYSSIRLDRKNQDGGGGVLAYISCSLVFERLRESNRMGTESSSFRIRLGKRKWVVLCNTYCPPSRSHTRQSSLDFDAFPSSPDSILLGDLNAHNHLWDPFQPQDTRGESLLDWAYEHDMGVMNNGSHTRENTRAARFDDPSSQSLSGGKSTPDVSLCGSYWTSRYTWHTTEAIGSSDHLPILITLNHQVKLHPIFRSQDRWCLARANWNAFSEEVEQSIDSAMPAGSSIDSLAYGFQETLIKAATSHVGTSRPGKGKKCWETPKVREAIRKRNRLRRHLSTRRDEWLEACKEARQAIDDAKTDAWRQVLEDVSNSPDDSRM